MAGPAPVPAPPRRGPRADFIPTDPAPVLAGCAVFAAVLFAPGILADGDTLWQVTTGDWILHHRAIPHTDPFSYTAGDRHWFAHEWLAEVLMALADRAGGLAGVVALAAAAAGLAAALLMRVLRGFLPGPAALTLWTAAVCLAVESLFARPHMLAWPCLVLWCGALVRARARRGVPSPAVLPAMTLWANLHGSFMLGLVLPPVLALEALLEPGADRRRVLATWSAFTAAAWAAALLNPELLGGLLFPFRHLGMASLAWIGEWRPASFARVTPLEVVLLALLALGLSGRLTLPPVRLLLLLGLVHEALAHVRNVQLLGLAGALLVAGPLARSLGQAPAPRSEGGWRPVPATVAALGAVAAMAALALRLVLPLPPGRTGADIAAALDALPPALRALPVLNDYGLGPNLIHEGIRPFIDSRADLYGDAFVERFRRLSTPDEAELRRVLAEYGVAWTVFPAGSALNLVLDALPGWHRVTGEPLDRAGLVVHARTEAP